MGPAASTLATCSAGVAGAPHHALRHAGRPAGVDEQQVVLGSLDAERLARAPLGDLAIRFGPRRGGAPDLEPRPHAGQTTPHAVDPFDEVLAEDDRRRIGVLEDVVELVVEIAVVDVDVDQARLEAGGQRLHVGRCIAQVETHFVACRQTTLPEASREIVAPPGEVAPRHGRLAVDQRRCVGGKPRVDSFEQISEVPGHRVGLLAANGRAV